MPRSILSLLLAVLASGCTEAGTQTIADSRSHYVAIVDRSTSITPAESESFRAITSDLVERLSFGDRLDIFVAYADGRGGGTVEASRAMPDALNPARPLQKEVRALESARESLMRATTEIFEAEPTEWTDLISSLRDAEEQFRGSRLEEKVLILLSDMLHCSPGDRTTCMDNLRWSPASTAALDQPDAARSLSGLESACVWVFGAEIENERDLAVRDFWSRYFEAVGAKFGTSRYYHGGGATPTGTCSA